MLTQTHLNAIEELMKAQGLVPRKLSIGMYDTKYGCFYKGHIIIVEVSYTDRLMVQVSLRTTDEHAAFDPSEYLTETSLELRTMKIYIDEHLNKEAA